MAKRQKYKLNKGAAQATLNVRPETIDKFHAIQRRKLDAPLYAIADLAADALIAADPQLADLRPATRSERLGERGAG